MVSSFDSVLYTLNYIIDHLIQKRNLGGNDMAKRRIALSMSSLVKMDKILNYTFDDVVEIVGEDNG